MKIGMYDATDVMKYKSESVSGSSLIGFNELDYGRKEESDE